MNRRSFLSAGACALVGATLPSRSALADAASLPSLPDYWQGYLQGVARKINSLKATTSDAFYFLTDVHMQSNRLWSGRILADLIARTRCRSVYCGGDVPAAFGDKETSADSLDAMIAQHRAYIIDPVVAAGGYFYGAKGNHDFTINASYNGKTYGTGVSYTYSAAYARDFIMARNPRPFAVTNAADPLACYYYRDAPHAKIRYIVIDTSDSDQAASTKAWAVGYCMHQPQIDWLAKYALGTLPSGWGAVIIGHIPLAPVVGTEFAVSSYNFGLFHRVLEAYQARGRIRPFNVEHDFSAAQGRILFCLSGHWHADRFSCHNGILHITQVCDTNYNDYRTGSTFCGTLPVRARGTVNEQGLDCYQTDSARDIVYATRIGAGGQDRVFHARPVSVACGGTRRFEAARLKGPLTWACYDGDQAVITDGASTPEDYVKFSNNRLVSVADGVLTAGTAGSGVVVAMDAAFNKEVFCVTVS